LASITIDIDSSVINVEGHQEGATKGYNPKSLVTGATTSSLPFVMNSKPMSLVLLEVVMHTPQMVLLN